MAFDDIILVFKDRPDTDSTPARDGKNWPCWSLLPSIFAKIRYQLGIELEMSQNNWWTGWSARKREIDHRSIAFRENSIPFQIGPNWIYPEFFWIMHLFHWRYRRGLTLMELRAKSLTWFHALAAGSFSLITCNWCVHKFVAEAGRRGQWNIPRNQTDRKGAGYPHCSWHSWAWNWTAGNKKPELSDLRNQDPWNRMPIPSIYISSWILQNFGWWFGIWIKEGHTELIIANHRGAETVWATCPVCLKKIWSVWW